MSEPLRVELDNGLRVVVRENHASPVVAMTLLVAGGSVGETPAQNGVTALLGRVLLKGTQRRNALELAQAAEDAGGSLSSAADQEYSEVRAHGLARHWQTLLDLVYEVTCLATLPADRVEREREALLAQLRSQEDEPFQVASRLLARALHGDQGYGLPVAGTAESVGALTRADLVARHGAYRAGDMVLAVSGAVTPAAVAAAAAERLGQVSAGHGTTMVLTPGQAPVHARLDEVRPVQQVQVLRGYLAPPVADPDHVPLKVLNAALGGGMSSRLFRVLRDERGLAYSVGSTYPIRRHASRLVVHIGTAPASAEAAQAGLEQVIEGVRSGPLAPDELRRARAALAGGFVLDARTNARQSFYLGLFELLGVGAGYLDRYPGLIEAVEPAEVQRVARRYLEAPAVVTVGPGAGADRAGAGAGRVAAGSGSRRPGGAVGAPGGAACSL